MNLVEASLQNIKVSQTLQKSFDSAVDLLKAGTPYFIHPETLRNAQKMAAMLCGIKKVSLLTASNEKIKKSNKQQKDLSVIMHFAPSDISGYNVCPMASPGCIKACLNTSGRGAYSYTQKARIKKTKLFFEHRNLFALVLYSELVRWNRKAKNNKLRLAVRLNGTSDVQWEVIYPWLFSVFSDVQYYDYTKINKRFERSLPTNYHLTFSRSENNERQSLKVLNSGHTTAVVFKDLKKAMRTGYKGFKVVDGVSTDRRFADKKAGFIIGLKALAKGRSDMTGFVVRN
jgi:hypothetical protein